MNARIRHLEVANLGLEINFENKTFAIKAGPVELPVKYIEALKADRQSNSRAAAAAYEQYLAENPESPHDLDVMLNLALVYWQSSEIGQAAAEKLSDDFVALAARRWPELLEKALVVHSNHPAPVFWKAYLTWAALGDDLDLELCRQLLEDHPEYHEPALALFALSGGTESVDRASRLLSEVAGLQTARGRYMRSVLESPAHPKLK